MKARIYGSAGLLACLSLAPMLALAQSPPPVPAPAPPQMPPPPAAPAAQYFYNDNGKPSGPITLDELRRKMAAGDIKPDTLVWKAGMPAWVAAKTLPELTVAGDPPKPQPPKLQPPAPQAPAPAPIAAPSPVAAQGGCSGGRTYLSDDFAQNPVNNPNYTIEEGKLKTKADPGTSQWFIYNRPLRLEKYQACVTSQLPNKFQDAAGSVAALIFSGASLDEFYFLAIAPNGQASVQRYHDKQILYVVEWKDFDALKLDAPAKNLLRAVVRGSAVETYINGQKFADITIEPPTGGTHVGLYFHSEQAQRDTWKFIGLRVTDMP